jgi:hypothetical protein
MTIIIPAKPLLCLALAVIIIAAVSGSKGGEEEFEPLLHLQKEKGGTAKNRDEGMGNGRRLLTLDPEREALFLETVNAEFERQKVRGAAYAFRGPVRKPMMELTDLGIAPFLFPFLV